MRIPHLQLWPYRPTDEQYIEQLRKRLRTSRWLRLFQASIGIALAALCIWAIDLSLNILTQPATPPSQQQLIYLIFGVAIILGLNLGLWISQTFISIAAALSDHRKDRMLVECWDTINALLAERDDPTDRQRTRPETPETDHRGPRTE